MSTMLSKPTSLVARDAAPDNGGSLVTKQKFRITNWHTYNKALINRGSMTFWLDDEAIKAWYETATHSAQGRSQRYADFAITTVLVIKRVFRLTMWAVQGFIDSIFTLMDVPLRCPNYRCISRRTKSVSVSFKTATRSEIAHIVIDSTGLRSSVKVSGKSENTAKSGVGLGVSYIRPLMRRRMKLFVQTCR